MAECGNCDGRGRVECFVCEGRGGKKVDCYKDGEIIDEDWTSCVECNGEGMVDCPECQ